MMDSNVNGVNPPVSNAGTEDIQEDGGQRVAVEDDLTVALRLSQEQEMERQERMKPGKNKKSNYIPISISFGQSDDILNTMVYFSPSLVNSSRFFNSIDL